MKDGYHEVNLPDGARFEGEVKNGMPNGRGRFTLPDGGVLKGKFKDALLHGLGVNVYPEGNPSGVGRQEGEFRDRWPSAVVTSTDCPFRKRVHSGTRRPSTLAPTHADPIRV